MKRSNKMRLIGITGGIGAGKSEILSYIRRHYNAEIYLADEVAHKVKEPGQVAYEPLVDLLGRDVLQQDGFIDKGKMAEKIFADNRVLEKVNEIVHPAVRSFLENAIDLAREKGETELFFIEAALLIEAGYKEIVDELWYIYADQSVREKRLKESRGYSDAKIKGIMEKQLSEEGFRKECDFVIDNSGSLEHAYRQIDERLEAYTWQDISEEKNN